MKTILLWDRRFPTRAPTRLTLDDALASACVRAGVAAAADPAEQGALSAGDALDPGAPVEVVLQHGPPQRLARVIVPASVAAVGVGLGVCAPIGQPIGGNVPPPATQMTISGQLAAGTIGAAYSGALTVAPSGAPTKISTEDAAMLAGFGLAWNGATSTLTGTLN